MSTPSEVQILAAALNRCAEESATFRSHVIGMLVAVQSDPEERRSYEFHLAADPAHARTIAELRSEIASVSGDALSSLPKEITEAGPIDSFLIDVALSEMVHRKIWDATLDEAADATTAMTTAIKDWRPTSP